MREEKPEENEETKDNDEDLEMDIDGDEKPAKSDTSLDGGNQNDSRNKFLKFCSSEDLVKETERTFQIITNFSLNEKLSLTNDDGGSIG